jgi:hypothetical protein
MRVVSAPRALWLRNLSYQVPVSQQHIFGGKGTGAKSTCLLPYHISLFPCEFFGRDRKISHNTRVQLQASPRPSVLALPSRVPLCPSRPPPA